MSSVSSLLSIGNSALSASQTALQVTGNNIANVDTEGYSRQKVVLKDGAYVTATPGQLGTGVVAQEVVRSHDAFIEAQYLQKLSARDRFKSLYGGLTSVQNLVNEANTDGVNAALSTFFSDWSELTGNTDSAATRQTMLDDTDTLLSLLRSTSDSMTQLEDQTNETIAADVGTLNQLAGDIADLNKQINMTQIDGASIPNGLYDQRDAKLRELASLVDVNVIDNGKGDITVNTNAGQTVVDGTVAYEFKFEPGQTVRQFSAASRSQTPPNDVMAYYEGADASEYTLKVVSDGTVGGGATFQASLDGGRTWLTDDSGNVATFAADDETGKVRVGNLDIWFGTTTDAAATPTSALNEGDTFTLVPKKALYWYTTAGTPVNVTPQQYADGTDNATRLTGGALAGAFQFRDQELGNYQNSLDAMTATLVWEANRIHSQGAGLTPFTSVLGTYSVADAGVPLGSPSSGLAFGDRLASGASMIAVYDGAGGLVANASITVDPATDSLTAIAQKISDAFPGSLTATVVYNRLSITAVGDAGFQFGADSAGLFAALGVNTLLTGSTASDAAVNSTVANDTSRVCVGHVGPDGLAASGDNTTATAMAALEDKSVAFTVPGRTTADQTLGAYYAGLVGKIGSDTANASYQTSYQTTLAAQLDAQQLAVSAVSLDEELTNLIKFQHSYQAAAKLISTANSLFETLLGLKN